MRDLSSSPASDMRSEVRPASFGVRNTPWDTTPARPGTSPAVMLSDSVREPTQWATTNSGRSPMRRRMWETAAGMSYRATSSYVYFWPVSLYGSRQLPRQSSSQGS